MASIRVEHDMCRPGMSRSRRCPLRQGNVVYRTREPDGAYAQLTERTWQPGAAIEVLRRAIMVRMRREVGILLLGLLLCAAGPSAVAAEREGQPVKHELELIYVFEGSTTEFIFVIGQSGFRSVEALKQHLETWPAGSELRWAPGCVRLGGEPLLSSEEEMEAFSAFLAQRGIKFVLVPSG